MFSSQQYIILFCKPGFFLQVLKFILKDPPYLSKDGCHFDEKLIFISQKPTFYITKADFLFDNEAKSV